jgi:hypothetical protein
MGSFLNSEFGIRNSELKILVSNLWASLKIHLSLSGQIYFLHCFSTNMLSLAGQIGQIFIVTINLSLTLYILKFDAIP